ASSDAWMAIGQSLEWRHPRDFAGVIEASSRAVALDPRNAEARHELGVHLSMVGRDSAAAAEFRAELAEDPTRGVAYFQLADLAAGDSSGARARAERLTSGPPDPVPTFWAGASAITLAAVGRPDDALGVLEQYPRGPRLWRILRRPEFDRLRSSPRFQRIVEE